MVPPFFLKQLAFIHQVQSFRNPVADLFFLALAAVDTPYFYAIFLLVSWFSGHYKKMVPWIVLLLLAPLWLDWLKHLFHESRPGAFDPSVAMLNFGGYSFPSGGALSAILYALFFSSFSHSGVRFILAPLVWALISFSRVYLGAHFPLDVIAGWCAGIILWAAFFAVWPTILSLLKRISPCYLLLAFLLVDVLLFSIHPTIRQAAIASVGAAFGVGLYISTVREWFWGVPVSLKEAIVRPALAAGVAYALWFWLCTPSVRSSFWLTTTVGLLTGLWLGCGAFFFSAWYYGKTIRCVDR